MFLGKDGQDKNSEFFPMAIVQRDMLVTLI